MAQHESIIGHGRWWGLTSEEEYANDVTVTESHSGHFRWDRTSDKVGAPGTRHGIGWD